MKVKLKDVDLIRTFGGVIVDMNESQAIKYVNRGLAVFFEKPKVVDQNKKINIPNEDKMVWSPPEEKLFSNIKIVPGGNYPGINDTLFSQIK